MLHRLSFFNIFICIEFIIKAAEIPIMYYHEHPASLVLNYFQVSIVLFLHRKYLELADLLCVAVNSTHLPLLADYRLNVSGFILTYFVPPLHERGHSL